MNSGPLRWENWDGHLKDGGIQHCTSLTKRLKDTGGTGKGIRHG